MVKQLKNKFKIQRNNNKVHLCNKTCNRPKKNNSNNSSLNRRIWQKKQIQNKIKYNKM